MHIIDGTDSSNGTAGTVEAKNLQTSLERVHVQKGVRATVHFGSFGNMSGVVIGDAADPNTRKWLMEFDDGEKLLVPPGQMKQRVYPQQKM